MIKFYKQRWFYLGCCLLVALFTVVGAYAQAKAIKGKVVDSSNQPVIGATVKIKGTSVGTITDVNGNYTVNAASKDVLVFSFVGYNTFEQGVGSKGVLNVLLKESAIQMDEVVAVGYATQKKANLTGAVANVDTKTLEARPIPDVGRGLQGVTPGLNVVIPSGEVGSDPVMKIRGQLGSVNGSTNPLILLDNVEIPSIQLVNPDDIESISVLKDAASASIYGSKGAFGVILIKTKKGAKRESVNVTYSNNFAFQNMAKDMKMGGLDALEYSVLAMERVGGTITGTFWKTDRAGYEKAKQWQEKYGSTIKSGDPMLYGRDWYVDANNNKIGLRTYNPYDYLVKEWTPSQTHNLSVNGKSGKTDYDLSFGYLTQQGINKTAKDDSFDRFNGSIRVGTEINKYVRIYGGSMYSKRTKNYPYATNSTTADPWLYIYRWGPGTPYGTCQDGRPVRSPAYEMGAANTGYMDTRYLTMNGGITITPMKNWVIDVDYTHANQDYTNKRPGTSYTAYDSWSNAVKQTDASGNQVYVNSNGDVVSATATDAMPAYQLGWSNYTGAGSNPDHVYMLSKNDQWNTFNVKSAYEFTVAKDHKAKLLLGLNSVDYKYSYNWSQKTQLIDYANPQFDLATGTQTSSGGEYWDSQFGVFGRINYSFKDRYLLEANLRYDGTSKFPNDLKWNWFPSFSAGWRVSEEPWMKWSSEYLSSFKLRGSWGSIGDQSVAGSLYIPTMTGSNTSWLINGTTKTYSFASPAAVSSDISWQTITTLDLGSDIRLFNNELGLSFDWYRRDTKNMINAQEGIPATYGASSPQGNFGSLRTNGIELQVDFNHRFKNGLGINVVATLADSKTEITKYGSTKSVDSWYVGKTYGEIWGYSVDRLYQKEDFVYGSDGKMTQITLPTGVKINQLADANAPTQGYLQGGNFYFGPGDVKFKDQNGDGKIDDGTRTVDDHGDMKVIGNSTPRYEYSLRLGADWKGVDVSVFMQGVGKRSVVGDGSLAIAGYNSGDGAMPEAIAGDFWREDRTNAFYPRPYNLSCVAGDDATRYNTVESDKYLLNMAYMRIKNITVGYALPASLLKKFYITKLRVYASLENFFTFDHLGSLPIDPEASNGFSTVWTSSVTAGSNTNYNSGRIGTGVPAFKTFSIGLQVNF